MRLGDQEIEGKGQSRGVERLFLLFTTMERKQPAVAKRIAHSEALDPRSSIFLAFIIIKTEARTKAVPIIAG